MAKKSRCVLCDTPENIIKNHHFSYKPSLTCSLCKKCHYEVHSDSKHFLNPWNPEGLWEGARYERLLSQNILIPAIKGELKSINKGLQAKRRTLSKAGEEIQMLTRQKVEMTLALHKSQNIKR